ncbi:hypothetical protein [Oceanobacillus halotolerans]|uniref:hypothetical protein n=1 Tax=Oceanobacillus halotolerans TaxID=2663380 RepID=UPI0013DADB5A|nr:hypothetical protein [Oceanobacillus halotolerans]
MTQSDSYIIITRDFNVDVAEKLNLVDYLELKLNTNNNEYDIIHNEEVIGHITNNTVMQKYFNNKSSLFAFVSDIYPGSTNEYKIKVSSMPKEELFDYVLKEVNDSILKQWIDITYKDYYKSEDQIKIKYRRTGCHNCKAPINTETHNICKKCKGIKCDCGSCLCDYNE